MLVVFFFFVVVVVVFVVVETNWFIGRDGLEGSCYRCEGSQSQGATHNKANVLFQSLFFCLKGYQ
jgi:hypothetical protein